MLVVAYCTRNAIARCDDDFGLLQALARKVNAKERLLLKGYDFGMCFAFEVVKEIKLTHESNDLLDKGI